MMEVIIGLLRVFAGALNRRFDNLRDSPDRTLAKGMVEATLREFEESLRSGEKTNG